MQQIFTESAINDYLTFTTSIFTVYQALDVYVFSFNPNDISRGRDYQDAHFLDVETEVQRDKKLSRFGEKWLLTQVF